MSQPKGVQLIVAADHEGGLVQRLKGDGFSTVANAVEQAALGPDKLEAAARIWATELAAAGVQVDLAPVADVVPEKFAAHNEPVTKVDLGYGQDPLTVGQRGGHHHTH